MMGYETNTAANPERSERRSTVTANKTPANCCEQNRDRFLARIKARQRECLASETVEEKEMRLATCQAQNRAR